VNPFHFKSFKRQAQGFIVVIDITKKETFSNIEKWLELIDLHSSIEDPPVLILANKCDKVQGVSQDLASTEKSENNNCMAEEIKSLSYK
jgi:GTPase SAR1 family protein